MSSGAKSLGKAVGVAGVAVSALTAGTVMLIKQTTAYAKELKIASQLSGISTEKLEAMAFATSTVGIGLEKLGDISKDTIEKVGDYLNTGGGGFQDFADAMKLTKEETRELATEFSYLTGTEVLQKMVSMMEDADVSAVQMSHALEGMASDTTNLIPLLADGGKKMQELSDSMASVTVPLTAEDLQKLEALDVALNEASASASSLANQTLISLSDWFINAGNSASFFFASLNEGTRANLQVQLLDNMEAVNDLKEKGLKLDNWLNNAITSDEELEKGKAERLEAINKLLEERKVIEADLRAFSEPDNVAPEMQTTEAGGVTGGGGSLGGGGGVNEDKIKAIADRFKSEEELLHQKLENELLIIGDNDELKEQLHAEHLENLLALDQKAEDEKLALKAKADIDAQKQQKKLDKDKAKQAKVEEKIKIDNARQDERMAQDAMSLAMLVFQDNKAVSAGIAVVNTAQGISKALATQNYAGAALTAVTGAMQISAILGASKGGGSVSSVPSSAPQEQAQQDFQADTTSLNFTDSTGGGASSNVITFATDSGDSLADAIAEALNKGQQEGRYT